METFKTKIFNIPILKGISEKTIEEHLKLYNGYVINSNLVLNQIKEYEKEPTKNAYILGELRRRFSFEFGGMINHEYYFTSLSDGPKDINKESILYKDIEKEWGSFDNFISTFKSISMTRGIGWTILYKDKKNNKLIIQWVDEQHIGHLISASPILLLDMWEHSYYLDYIPAEKKKYVESFFENLNWSKIEENYNI